MEYLALLRRNPLFARLWLAEAVSMLGDWFTVVAISVLAVQEGGGSGALAVGVTIAAHDLPMALMRPWAGVLADRFDRRNLLIGVHLFQTLTTLMMAERAWHADVAALQVLVFVRSIAGGLDWPARSGAIRRLVGPDDLMVAHALGGSTWSAMFAFGMALGGLVATFGVPQALLIDAMTFAVGAALLATLPPIPTRGEGSVWNAARRALGDLGEAARLAGQAPGLFRAVASRVPLALAGGAGVVFLNLAADRTAFMGSGAATLGILQACRGLGTGVGPLVARGLVVRGYPLIPVWAGCAALGLVGMVLFTVPGPWVLLPLTAFIWGAGTGANWMMSSAELQRNAPDEAIGRLSGLDMLCVEGAFAVSALVGGLVVEQTGVERSGIWLGIAAGALLFAGVQLVAGRREALARA